MLKRSDIDWSNPPEPTGFAEVTLPRRPGKPAVIHDYFGLVLLKAKRAKTGPALWLPALIYYIREACIRFPAFREELQDMLSKLPRS